MLLSDDAVAAVVECVLDELVPQLDAVAGKQVNGF